MKKASNSMKGKAGNNGKAIAQGEAVKRNNRFYRELLPYLDATVDYLVTDQECFSVPLVMGTIGRFCNLVEESEIMVKAPKGMALQEDFSEWVKAYSTNVTGERMERHHILDAFVELLDLQFLLKGELSSGQTGMGLGYALAFVSLVEVSKIKLRYLHDTGQLVKSDAVENRGKWIDPGVDCEECSIQG